MKQPFTVLPGSVTMQNVTAMREISWISNLKEHFFVSS